MRSGITSTLIFVSDAIEEAYYIRRGITLALIFVNFSD
jgi:hypothetical protein